MPVRALPRRLVSVCRLTAGVVVLVVLYLIFPVPQHIEDTSSPRKRLHIELQQFLEWDPPTDQPGHYPWYNGYKTRDYDPNRWEAFPQNNGIYLNGTLKHRLPDKANPFQPHPDYDGHEYRQKYAGTYHVCKGPNGKPIHDDASKLAKVYRSVPKGFPAPAVGSWEALKIDGDVCFDRIGRLGPYGLTDTDKMNSKMVDLPDANWGKLQDECLQKNVDRFTDPTIPELRPSFSSVYDEPEHNSTAESDEPDSLRTQGRTGRHTHAASQKARTAILIRTWDDYKYQDNDILAIRSLVSELSLQSGGEYHVLLFVNVKNRNIPIFRDEQSYQRALDAYVPAEFRDMAILWNEQICQESYPEVGRWDVYWEQFMSVQWFSRTHPEFEYIWNWEMDARLIGHHYHFLQALSTFAMDQPRKYLWERNARYYIPGLHGTWDQYFRDSNSIIQAAKGDIQTVWGAQPWMPDQPTLGPKPPHDEAQDAFSWGVGEEADLITLLPIWDPRETWWTYRDNLVNYPPSNSSTEDRQFPDIPRRVFINTLARFSKRLLRAMHTENLEGLSMASEMWPASVALQHGLKAVYAPHPIWQSHVWDPKYLDYVFNADGWGAGSLPGTDPDSGRGAAYNADLDARNKPQVGSGPNREGRFGRWGQERDGPYGPEREHNFAGWSWYFWSDFPRVLYRRWLGWEAGLSVVSNDRLVVIDELGTAGGRSWEKEHGRLCLPHMLLHPVKNMKP